MLPFLALWMSLRVLSSQARTLACSAWVLVRCKSISIASGFGNKSGSLSQSLCPRYGAVSIVSVAAWEFPPVFLLVFGNVCLGVGCRSFASGGWYFSLQDL